jgi:hypothetical protein
MNRDGLLIRLVVIGVKYDALASAGSDPNSER